MSNSNQQREYIEEQARERGIANLKVFTGDVAKVVKQTNTIHKQTKKKQTNKCNKQKFLQVDPEDFQVEFDRVISIEMFEHMKNYGKLLKKVSISFSHYDN